MPTDTELPVCAECAHARLDYQDNPYNMACAESRDFVVGERLSCIAARAGGWEPSPRNPCGEMGLKFEPAAGRQPPEKPCNITQRLSFCGDFETVSCPHFGQPVCGVCWESS